MRKAHRNRPLTENQTKRNRYLSKTRYVVEQSFGTLHRKFRYARAAYFGLIKVSAQSHLKAMCLNLLKAANRLSAPVAASKAALMPDYQVSGEKKVGIWNKKQLESWVWVSAAEGRKRGICKGLK